MHLLGSHIPRVSGRTGGGATLVACAQDGRILEVRRSAGLSEWVADVSDLVGDEPFLLGLDVPVVVPAKAARSRPIENLVRRRLGVRLEPGGRAARDPDHDGGTDLASLTGETALGLFAGTGRACLSYPERDRRTSGLVEVHPDIVIKSLLWQGSGLANDRPPSERAALLQAYAVPEFRARSRRKRSWTDRLSALDIVTRAIDGSAGFDLEPVRAAIVAADSESDVERAEALFDAVAIAGTVARYLDAPETCLFLGDRSEGYTVLPADGFIRQIAARDAGGPKLFPQASLHDRLSKLARLRSLDLLAVEGKPHRTEATFHEPPLYEFDNVDEMLWWKHCRHLAGDAIPTDGLLELGVSLESSGDAGGGKPLGLTRSRHRTLSFRFDPPAAWRKRLATRDGKPYAFRILRAVYLSSN